MSKIFAFSLYFTSFVLLWISILFIDIKSCIENNENIITEAISIICILIFTLVCTVILMVCLCTNGKEGGVSAEIVGCKRGENYISGILIVIHTSVICF